MVKLLGQLVIALFFSPELIPLQNVPKSRRTKNTDISQFVMAANAWRVPGFKRVLKSMESRWNVLKEKEATKLLTSTK